MLPVPDLSISVTYILLTLLLAYACRKITDIISTPGSLAHTLFQEAIAGAELCGCCFELIIIADNYGVLMYALFLFLLTIWWSRNWGDATACAYTHIEDLIQGTQTIDVVLLKIWAELTGGVLIFRYIRRLWRMEFAFTHKGRAFAKCVADLQVPFYYGALIECFATCLCRMVSKSLGDLQPRFATAIDAFVGTSLVVAAFNYSGGYFNPVLATSLKYGCKGHSAIEHIIVYWIGATLGAVGSVYLYNLPRVRNFIAAWKYKVRVD